MKTFIIAIVAFLSGMLLLDIIYKRDIPYDKPYHRDVLLNMISNCQRVNQTTCTLQSVYNKEAHGLVWVVGVKTEDKL